MGIQYPTSTQHGSPVARAEARAALITRRVNHDGHVAVAAGSVREVLIRNQGISILTNSAGLSTSPPALPTQARPTRSLPSRSAPSS